MRVIKIKFLEWVELDFDKLIQYLLNTGWKIKNNNVYENENLNISISMSVYPDNIHDHQMRAKGVIETIAELTNKNIKTIIEEINNVGV